MVAYLQYEAERQKVKFLLVYEVEHDGSVLQVVKVHVDRRVPPLHAAHGQTCQETA